MFMLFQAALKVSMKRRCFTGQAKRLRRKSGKAKMVLTCGTHGVACGGLVPTLPRILRTLTSTLTYILEIILFSEK